MALSPLDTIDPITDETTEITADMPTKTYAMDFTAGDIGGEVTGLDAIKQYIVKAIKTARFRFSIYDTDYGSEIEDLIGQDVTVALLETEIPRVIEEAIIYDDRILSVYDFTLTREGDRLYVSFYVETAESNIPMEVVI
jgi:phage baseplate assembly protein W